MASIKSCLLPRRAGATHLSPPSVSRVSWVNRYRWWALPLVVISLGIALPGALVAVPELPKGPMFPLHKVEVSGDLQRLDPQQLRQRLLPSTRGGFFDIDVLQMRALVSDIPWVASVQINRQWPDQLVITITEREPVARWRSEGLLDSDGNFFKVDSLLEFSALPLLSGPDDSEQQIFEGYRYLRTALAQLPQPVQEIDMDRRGVWRLRTNDGELLTFRGAPKLAPLTRLVEVYRRQLLPHWDKVRKVDLRYSDGLAVAFAPNTVQVEQGSRQ